MFSAYLMTKRCYFVDDHLSKALTRELFLFEVKIKIWMYTRLLFLLRFKRFEVRMCKGFPGAVTAFWFEDKQLVEE